METLPIRLPPGRDLRSALEAALRERGCAAGFVLSGIGSLSAARLRFAGARDATALEGDFEILTLAGSLAGNGSHLHATLAGADGAVLGGHVAPGCVVRTTAEVLIVLLPQWALRREFDAATGYDELVVARRAMDRSAG